MTLFSAGHFDGGASGPLYLQLQRHIAAALAAGELTPGDCLPAERDMAQMTGLSRVTVRKAIQELVATGQLVQRRGSGTYVAQKVERLEQAFHDWEDEVSGRETAPVSDDTDAVTDLPRQRAETMALK